MVRAANEAAASDRVDSSLANRGLTLTQEQRSKVVALPCDLSKHDLGLGESRIQELSTKLTTVIHSAWAVNFNISVSSFEDQHIKAVHNLIQLTLSVQTPRPALQCPRQEVHLDLVLFSSLMSRHLPMLSTLDTHAQSTSRSISHEMP